MEPILLQSKIYEKGWGKEIWIVNTPQYCLKYLDFKENGKFSMHFHSIKKETWTIQSGRFLLHWIDTKNADIHFMILEKDMIIDILPNLPHQIECLESGRIIEVSTQHLEDDNYRVLKGDSQSV
jgi:hypothetical protein